MTPIPMAVRSKVWVCGRSFAGIAGSNPVSVLCCQVEVSTTGRSPALPSVMSVTVCDIETSTMTSPWRTRAVQQCNKTNKNDRKTSLCIRIHLVP